MVQADIMVISTEPSGTVYISASWCGEVLTAPLILPQEPLAWEAYCHMESSLLPAPKTIALSQGHCHADVQLRGIGLDNSLHLSIYENVFSFHH